MKKLTIVCIAAALLLLTANCSVEDNCDGGGFAWNSKAFMDHMIAMHELNVLDKFPVFAEQPLLDGESVSTDSNEWGTQRDLWVEAVRYLKLVDGCNNKKPYQEAGLFPITLPPKELLNIPGPPSRNDVRNMNAYLQEIAYQVDWYYHRYPFG